MIKESDLEIVKIKKGFCFVSLSISLLCYISSDKARKSFKMMPKSNLLVTLRCLLIASTK